MKKTKLINQPDRIRKVQSFLSGSIEDYVASRVLFLSNLPQQAAIISSTAIEKCFKAILAFNGNESHGHLQKAHWNAVKNFDRELYSSLNPDFLELNKKVYSLRYTDNLPAGYNVVIASREFLSELDQTMLLIIQSFKVGDTDEIHRITKLEHLIESGDERICKENHIVSKQNKNKYIYSQPQFIYELRHIGNGALFEVTYWSDTRPDNPSFLRSGFTPCDSTSKEQSFKLSFSKVLRNQ